jgi:hypothetical protein
MEFRANKRWLKAQRRKLLDNIGFWSRQPKQPYIGADAHQETLQVLETSLAVAKNPKQWAAFKKIIRKQKLEPHGLSVEVIGYEPDIKLDFFGSRLLKLAKHYCQAATTTRKKDGKTAGRK